MINQVQFLVPILAAFVTVMWAFSKFFYKERRHTKERTGHLVLKCNMNKLGEKENMNVVNLSLTIKNNSDTKMYVLADYVNIYGITMNVAHISEEDYLKYSAGKIMNKKYAYLHRFVRLKEKILAFSGKIFNYDEYWWLERDEKLCIDRITYVPKSFDYIEMVATVYYSANKDWLDVKTFPTKNEMGLQHEVILNTPRFKGDKFDWHNKGHLALHFKYKNAEITNSALLVVK